MGLGLGGSVERIRHETAHHLPRLSEFQSWRLLTGIVAIGRLHPLDALCKPRYCG